MYDLIVLYVNVKIPRTTSYSLLILCIIYIYIYMYIFIVLVYGCSLLSGCQLAPSA